MCTEYLDWCVMVPLVTLMLVAGYMLYLRLTNPQKYRYNGVYHQNRSIPKWFRKDDNKK